MGVVGEHEVVGPMGLGQLDNQQFVVLVSKEVVWVRVGWHPAGVRGPV